MITYNAEEDLVNSLVEEHAAGSADLGERTYVFARRILRLYRALPQATEAQVVGKQLLRSGTSIGANYCEAKASRSRAEFNAKLGDCLKEASESSYWLRLMADEGILPAAKLTELRDEAAQICSMLAASLLRSKGLRKAATSASDI